MTTISKAFVGAVAAGAMAVVPVASASAGDRYDNDRGISAGEIIAGAVVLGGIAAVAASIGGNNRNDSRYYRDGRYDYYNGNPRAAVEQCVNAARRDARSRGYRFAEVTQVRDVNDTNYGWKIKGNLQVDGNRGYYDRGYSNRYGRNNGYYNNARYNSAHDSGRFTCWIDRGRVAKMDYSGIRNM